MSELLYSPDLTETGVAEVVRALRIPPGSCF